MRTHLVDIAGAYCNQASGAAKVGDYNYALFCMREAYNHVENALASERERVAALEAQIVELKSINLERK